MLEIMQLIIVVDMFMNFVVVYLIFKVIFLNFIN